MLFLSAALLAGVAVFHFWPESASAEQPSTDKLAPAEPAPPSARLPAKPARPVVDASGETPASKADTPPLPSSLEGTEVDGSLDVDDEGHLILSPRVIALFDYFFSAGGEEPDSAIRARIEAYARAHLSAPALDEALDLLGNYVAYRKAGQSLAGLDSAPPRERLTAIQKLRRAHFGDDAEALFGAEERAAEVAIEKSRIAQTPGLDTEERDALFAEAESRLPEAEKQARKEVTQMLTLRADEAILREGGADAATIRRYRESQFGSDAADRLEALDTARAAFKARIEAFKTARAQQCGAPADAQCETVFC
ncbi:MAG: lipase secretion chaperone [Polyangiaceae bacterium]